MPHPLRLTTARENEIILAYEAWDPEAMSVTELAASYGISRQGLYGVLRRNGVEPRSARNVGQRRPSPVLTDELLDRMAQQALRALLDELETAKTRLAALLEHVALDHLDCDACQDHASDD